MLHAASLPDDRGLVQNKRSDHVFDISRRAGGGISEMKDNVVEEKKELGQFIDLY